MTALAITQPLSTYSDELSRVESTRHRFHLRLRGLSLPGSQCPATATTLLHLNLQFTSGSRSQDVVCAYSKMICSTKTDECWCGFAGVEEVHFANCFKQLAMAMCDSWRRLHLPTKFLPLRLFYIASPERTPSEAADFLEHVKTSFGICGLCMDGPFTKAL